MIMMCLKNSTDCNSNVSSISLNGTSEEKADIIHEVVAIAVPIIFGFVSLVGFVGNALVVLVVTANQQMRSTTNLLILNLAIADLLFIIFCVPFTATDYALRRWPFGLVWCKMVQYLIVVTAYASVYTLVFMSLDRFLAVVHPIASRSWRTVRNAILAIVISWIVFLTVSIPVFISHGLVEFTFNDDVYTSCLFLDSEDFEGDFGYNRLAFRITFFLTSYVVPLFLTCILYLLMLSRLWRGNVGGHVSAEARRGKKRVTRMVVIVVVIFAVCWCPIQIILVLKSFNVISSLSPIHVSIQIFSQVLAYMNSCMNPILYAYLSDNFRKAFRKVVLCYSPTAAGPGGRITSIRGACGEVTHPLNATNSTRVNGSNHDIL